MSEQQQSFALPGDPVARPTHHDIECGCRIELDPDGPIWLTEPCAEHAADDRSAGLMRVMGLELDDLVTALTGRALEPRRRPKDPYR